MSQDSNWTINSLSENRIEIESIAELILFYLVLLSGMNYSILYSVAGINRTAIVSCRQKDNSKLRYKAADYPKGLL